MTHERWPRACAGNLVALNPCRGPSPGTSDGTIITITFKNYQAFTAIRPWPAVGCPELPKFALEFRRYSRRNLNIDLRHEAQDASFARTFGETHWLLPMGPQKAQARLAHILAVVHAAWTSPLQWTSHREKS